MTSERDAIRVRDELAARLAPLKPSASQRCTELAAGVLLLNPVLFSRRVAEWRRGGLPAGSAEVCVSSSSSFPIPVTQPTDSEGNPTGPPRLSDAIDRELQLANRAYFDSLDDMGRLLAAMMGLEQKYLIAPHVATEEEREIAADLGHQCAACGRVVANTPRDPVKSNFCEACYRAWNKAARPDRVLWIVQRRAALGQLEVSG